MSKARLATTLTVAVLASACASHGHRFDPQAADALRPGVSTTADAASLLGPHTAESHFPDGTRLLQWKYFEASPLGAGAAHLAVLFDEQGRMVRIAHRHQSLRR